MSTPDTPPPHDQQLLLRATANATWRPLRQALQDARWPYGGVAWIHHDPRGNPKSRDKRGGGIPGVLRTYTRANETGRVVGRLAPDHWPGGGLVLAARLTQDDYDMMHAQLAFQEQYEWAQAIVHSTARQPFLVDVNRHGNPVLRRNHDPGALITPLVVDFLMALAGVTHVQLLTPEREAEIELALLDDQIEALPDPIRANEVFAIAQRSGLDEPER